MEIFLHIHIHHIQITSSDGYAGVKYIDELFKIEKEIANLNMDEKKKIRQEKSEPILKKFY